MLQDSLTACMVWLFRNTHLEKKLKMKTLELWRCSEMVVTTHSWKGALNFPRLDWDRRTMFLIVWRRSLLWAALTDSFLWCNFPHGFHSSKREKTDNTMILLYESCRRDGSGCRIHNISNIRFTRCAYNLYVHLQKWWWGTGFHYRLEIQCEFYFQILSIITPKCTFHSPKKLKKTVRPWCNSEQYRQ